eukprot:m51a1_g12821 hypothetical protein (459) ;mRNA; r:1992-3368
MREAYERAAGLAGRGLAARVSPSVYWVGGVDFGIRDFHGIDVPGSTYNAYLVLGESPTLVDTVKAPFADALLASVERLVDPELVRYVVVNHAEPDHASALPAVMQRLRNAELVCTKKCKDALLAHYRGGARLRGEDVGAALRLDEVSALGAGAEGWNYRVVRAGETLQLGEGQTLWFTDTPMVHWPESTWTALVEERVLFSMDAFGQHLATRARFDDECSEASGALGEVLRALRSYYANIFLPFNRAVARALERAQNSAPAGFWPPLALASAHGVVWRGARVGEVLGLYRRWSAGTAERKVLVLYDTMYGSTERLARALLQGVADYRDAATGASASAVMVVAKDAVPTDAADHVIDCACVAVGSPCLNNSLLPSLARHLAYLRGLRPEGRHGCAFGSYGWSNSTVPALEAALKEMGVDIAVPGATLACQYVPDDAVLRRCYDAGRKLAAIAIATGKPY